MKLTCCVLCLAFCVISLAVPADAREFLPGLAGHYYKDATNWNGLWPDDTDAPLADPKACTFTKFEYTRVEPLINHLFIRSGWFSVRWVGYIDIPGNEANTFLFEVWADDGCRLQIGDAVLINSWYACPEDIDASHRTATATLAPGKHRIIVEYFQGQSLEQGDHDPVKLYWACSKLNIPKKIVSASVFSHEAADEGTPDAWAIKPPQTNLQLVQNTWDDAQKAEQAGDYAHALRLYRSIVLMAPDSPAAAKAKERILAIEADPRLRGK